MEPAKQNYHFHHITPFTPKTFSTHQGKEVLTQWGLENFLKVNKFRIDGSVRKTDHENILSEFLSDQTIANILELSGTLTYPVELDLVELKTTVRSMEFFDRLQTHGILSASGTISGCFEEMYDGIMVGDLLREMLLNRDSINCDIYSEEEKDEFIFKLFKILCVGGSMCQPDTTTSRYLEIAKALYKELLVLYKASDSGDIRCACRVFDIKGVGGYDIFPTSANSSNSSLIIVVNHMEKLITTIKMTHSSFW